MTSPDVIRGALLFEQSYLFLFMASAVGTAVDEAVHLCDPGDGSSLARARDCYQRRLAAIGRAWARCLAELGPSRRSVGCPSKWLERMPQ